MNIEDLKSIMDAFDPASLLQELEGVLHALTVAVRLAILAGPAVVLVLGLVFLVFAPKEANYRFGYRCFFGMGSVEAWRYTQRIAGLLWSLVGALLTVISVFTAMGYGGKEIMEVVDSAVTLLIWEVVLTILSCLGINGLAMYYFDRNGNRRNHTRK